MNTKEKFNVGDYVMIDGGGVAHCKYAKIKDINDTRIKLENVYTRKRVDTYPNEIDTYSFDLIATCCNDGNFTNFYHITKAEYNTIVDAYMQYSKLMEKMSEIYRRPYFDSKKR